MALSSESRKILQRIQSIGRQVGATPKEIKAAIETGIVESGLRNLPGGDADSAGWRQERASLYKDPTNLDASIRRFFDETRKVRGKYGRAGDLAAAVQRPAAQYRGRYQQVSAQAQKLMEQMGGGGGGGAQASMATMAAPQADTGAQRQAILSQYLSMRGRPGALAALGSGLTDLENQPAPAAMSQASSTPSAPTSQERAKILELFWQGPGGVNVKNGKRVPQGFVGGHDRHVHVAAPTEKEVLRLAKLAQSMDLDVGEHPKFGGVGGGHVEGSNHYARRAIDVTGEPAKLRAFAHRVAAMAR